MATSMNTIDTMVQERTDLDLHVDLCAKRYHQLDSRLGTLEVKMDDVKDSIDAYKSVIIKSLIATAGTVVVAICGLAGVILTTYPIH